MKLFQKLHHHAHRLFHKIKNDNNLFNKISIGARKFDNTVQKIGSFVVPVAHQFGQHHIADAVHGVVQGVHHVRNHLEKAIKHHPDELRKENHNYA